MFEQSRVERYLLNGEQTWLRASDERRQTREADSLGSQIDSQRRKSLEQDVADEGDFEQTDSENAELERTDEDRQRAAGQGHTTRRHRRGPTDDCHVKARYCIVKVY